MNILIEKKYWNLKPVINNFTKQKYWLISYPDKKYDDYICQIPEEFVLFRNNKPYGVEVWEKYIFKFEKQNKIPGKKFKRITLSATEIEQIYPTSINQLKMVFASHPEYKYNVISRQSEVVSLKIKPYYTDGTWLYEYEDKTVRKRYSADGLTILKDTNPNEVNLFLELIEKLKKIRNKIDDLKNELTYRKEICKNRNFKERNSAIKKYLLLDEEIINVLNKDILDLKNSPDNQIIEHQLFEITYNVDINNFLSKSVIIKFSKDASDNHNKSYTITGFEYPQVILSNNNHYFFHEIEILEGI